MDYNPYPPHKTIQAEWTLCETCERRVKTVDWNSHKSGKGHRRAEQKASGIAAREKSLAQREKDIDAHIKAEAQAMAKKLAEAPNATSSWDNANTDAPVGNWADEANNEVAAAEPATTEMSPGWNPAPTHHGRGRSNNNTGNRGDNANRGTGCFNCGEEGHMSRECTNPRQSRGGGGGPRTCHNCGEEGHISRDCPQPRQPRQGGGGGGGGAGRACHNCGQEGHFAKDCTEPRVIKCKNCDEVGHMSRECPHPTDWSRVQCRNCGEMGHTVKRCKQPIQDDNAGYGGGGSYSGGAGSGYVDDGGADTAVQGNWDSAPAVEGNWDSTPAVEATGGWDDAPAA